MSKQQKSFFGFIGSAIGKSVIWFDRFVNWTVGKWNGVWSEHGGETGQTISHTLGLEEAEALYNYYLKGMNITEIKDIPIEGKHLLGEFSSDLCDLFQRYHALRSIDWRKANARALKVKCPDIEKVVRAYLTAKGIKE